MARRPDPYIAVAYLRASLDDQRNSPDAQRAAIAAWASAAGVTVGAWHVDQGVSGGSELEGRPGLLGALADLRAVNASALVVARRDRLARDVAVAATIEKAVGRSGARVISADGVGNGDSAADGFIRTMLDAAAAYERALIRARTRSALQAKRARGERAGAVPFGYADAGDGRLVRDDREQAVILAVRDLRATGWSVRAIAAECGRRGYTSRAGTPLQKTQVHRILGRADDAA